jgi:vacuolar protein sorting-associated protein 13A/C
LLPVDHLSHG